MTIVYAATWVYLGVVLALFAGAMLHSWAKLVLMMYRGGERAVAALFGTPLLLGAVAVGDGMWRYVYIPFIQWVL